MHDLCFHGTQLFGHIDWVSVLGRLFHDQRDAERAEREVGMSVIQFGRTQLLTTGGRNREETNSRKQN